MSVTQPIREPELLQKFKDYYCSSYPNIRNYTLCVMGLNTALRITDILNLKWENIYNFRTGKFLIHLTVIEKKTQKTNMIALNEALRETLSLYFEAAAPSAEQYLFVSRNGINQPLSRSQAFRIIKKAAVSAGMLQNISCHSLRKTFGYHAWQQGVPPVLLMEIYNHSSYQITKRYLGIEQDDKDKVFLNMNL